MRLSWKNALIIKKRVMHLTVQTLSSMLTNTICVIEFRLHIPKDKIYTWNWSQFICFIYQFGFYFCKWPVGVGAHVSSSDKFVKKKKRIVTRPDFYISIIHTFPHAVSSEAALRRCSYKKVFWKYLENLQENTHVEVWFA